MATNPATDWSLAQRFTVRASTALIGYVLLFVGISLAMKWLPDGMQGPIHWWQRTGVLWLWLPAAILALAFLLSSLVRRNPQAQFFLELVVAVSLAAFLTVY